jgi:serine/threonine-protein kinase
LAKLPADRYASAAQFVEALAPPTAGSPVATPPVSAAPPARASLVGRPLAIGIAAAALGAGVLLGWMVRGSRQTNTPTARFSIPIPVDHNLSGGPNTEIALSPDGSVLAYVGENAAGLQLYVRRLEDFTAAPVPGTEGAGNPQFSLDGRWIAFFAGSQLKKILVTGGAPVTIPTPPGGVQAVQWTGPDQLVVTTADGVLGRLKGDGSLDRIAAPDPGQAESALIPQGVLPDGNLLCIAASQGSAGPIVIIDPHSGKRTVVSKALATGVGYDAGYLVWAQQDGTLFAAPFDAGQHRVVGSILTLAPSVRVSVGGPAQLSVSRNASLVYMPALPFDLVETDRAGHAVPIAQIQRRFHSPRVSPDGRKVAVDFIEQGARDMWLLDLRDHTLSRLSFDHDGHDPTWMPDGREILYATARNGVIGVFRRAADGSGTADSVLVQEPGLSAHTVTPDGHVAIAVSTTGKSGSFDILTIPLTGERRAEPLLSTPFNEGWPALSPDGRWLAYVSDESGRQEVYVRPFPGPGGKVLVSQNGGSEPVWARSGRELFYRGSGAREPEMVAATVEAGSEFRVLSRTALFGLTDYEPASPHANFDVTPDGQHFVLVHQGRLGEIVLVQNWTELVKRQSASTSR